MDEVLRKFNIQAVAQLLSAAFSNIYSETEEQKAEQNVWKNSQFVNQKSPCKTGASEGRALKETGTIEKKAGGLHQKMKGLTNSSVNSNGVSTSANTAIGLCTQCHRACELEFERCQLHA